MPQYLVISNAFVVIMVAAWAVVRGAEYAIARSRHHRSETILKSIDDTGKATHILTNSARGDLLKLGFDTAKRLAIVQKRMASITKEPGDLAAARDAEAQAESAGQLYEKHVEQQAIVDKKADAEKD